VENLKIQIKIEDNDNLKEAHNLLLKLGFSTYSKESFDVWDDQPKPIWLKTNCFDDKPNKIDWVDSGDYKPFKEITLPELRDLVVLKRNDVGSSQPEELPFIDDEPSLNDQYAEIEKARQSAWQKQEGGSHYKNLKIQPMQYALENKLDYAQANVVKYVTRHKEKNGKEDLLKAIHNLELMIEFYYGGGE
jgi:hypothetical protein